MSKRFGRNQKRKLRAEIERLHRVEADRDLFKNRYRATENRLVEWARIMNHHLGDFHVLNEEVKTITLQRNVYLDERYNLMKPIKFNAFMDQELQYSSMSMVESYIRNVIHSVSVRRDGIQYHTILQLEAPDNQAYYAIDEEILYQGRTDPRFINWIAKELAHKLAA